MAALVLGVVAGGCQLGGKRLIMRILRHYCKVWRGKGLLRRS